MNNPYRYLSACAWAGGPFFIVATIVFWGLLGHNIPPYSAGLSAAEFAEEMITHAAEIRIGMVLQILVSVLWFIWGLSIAKVMETVEQDNNVLSTMQLFSAGLGVIFFLVPCAIWLAIVYRPEAMQPETLLMFYDFSWILFDTTFAVFTMGIIAMGICFLSDQRNVPLVPSWVCWLVICIGVGFVLILFMPFLLTGPLSRSGILNFWIEFTLFFVYWSVTSVYIIRAIARLEREHQGAGALEGGHRGAGAVA